MNARRGLWFAAIGLVLMSSAATATPSPTRVHFTAAGDYSANNNTAAVLDAVAAAAPDLHWALGDLSYGVTGAEQAWCDFVKGRVGEGFPFQLISGNHESDGLNGNINDFSACLPNQLPGAEGTYGRQYFVDVPQAEPLIRFLMISPGLQYPEGPTDYSAGSAAYEWTETAIDEARADGIPWIVVGMHKPCLSTGVYPCEVGPDIVHLLMQKKVDLVLSGHEHSYQRTKQLSLGVGCTKLAIGSYDADCVRDADDDFAAGAGTVFQTIGTGGVGQRDHDLLDTELDYFAALGGSNAAPTFGMGDFVATPENLTVQFVRAAGAALTDAFTITKPTTPEPNEAPSAQFTAVPDGLQVTLDGSTSSDVDGAVVGYRWDFGDGHDGFGATTQHVYTSPGTYDVALTVTDDDGATHTTVQPVTVEGEQPPEIFAADSFSRVLTGTWGAAETGGAWTASKPSAVSDGVGRLTLGAPGAQVTAYLNGVQARDVDVTVDWALDKLPTGSGTWAYQTVVTRKSGAGQYKAFVQVSPAGLVRATLRRNTGADVILGSAVTVPLTYVQGDVLRLRTQTVGVAPTTLRLKVWKKGAPEPAGWLVVRTDSTPALEAPGSVGLMSRLSSGVTNTPLQARFDDFLVQEPGTPQ